MANFFTRPNFEDRQIVQYSADTITLSGDTNINSTGNFRIYKDAFPGLVATSLDNDGTVGWGPISGISWSVSACTSPLYVNNLVSCPSSGGTIQVDAGNLALNSELNFLISLSAGTNTDEVLVIDSNGYIKTVPQLGGVGNMWYVPYGYTLMIPDNYQSFVYGDVIVEGVIDLQTNAQLVVLNGNIVLSGGSIVGSGTTYLVTLGGNSCCFTGGTGSCITDLYVTNIHGCSPIHIQPTSADDVIMVEGGGNVGIGLLPTVKLHVSGETIVNSNKMMLSDSLTTIPSVGNFEGIFSVHDSLGLQGFLSNNTNPSGITGTRMYNDLSVDGLLSVGGSQTNRQLTPLTGNDFYRNKIILKGGTTSEGMVFNAASSDPSSTFWWEFNSASGMVLKGDGSTTGAYLGLALNPDGTEMPTSSLQIGGTGTTGTFQYRDGNESSGYVLTSDTDGNASWQAPTGGGSGTTIVQFTGNTSGDCITDLWVTNIHGCSPVLNLNNSLNANDNNTVEIDFISGKTDNTNTIDFNYGTFSGIKISSDGPYTSNRYLSLSEDIFGGATVLANGTSQYLALYGSGANLAGGEISLLSNAGLFGLTFAGTSIYPNNGRTFLIKTNESGGDPINSQLIDGGLNAEFITGKQNSKLPTGEMGTGLGVNITGTTGSEFYTVFISTPRSRTYNNTSYSTIWNNVIAGGSDHKIYTGGTDSFIGGGTGNTINQNVKRSVILGGQNITATTSNTVYVPDLIIKKSSSVPTTSGDTVGEIGSVTWNDSYLYIKTNTGWGRISLDYVW